MAEFWENDPVVGGDQWWANDPVAAAPAATATLPAPTPVGKFSGGVSDGGGASGDWGAISQGEFGEPVVDEAAYAKMNPTERRAAVGQFRQAFSEFDPEAAGYDKALKDRGIDNWVERTGFQAISGIGGTGKGLLQTAGAAVLPDNYGGKYLEKAALNTAREQQGIQGAVDRQQGTYIGRMATGVVSSLSKVLASAPAGFGGMLATQFYDSAMAGKVNGLKQGMSDDEASRAGIASAVPEAVITTAFQAVGLGGAEQAILNGAKWGGAKKFLGSLLQEFSEEELITFTTAATDQMTGLDPEALAKSPKQAVDTAVQVAMTMGLIGGHGKLRQFAKNPSRRTAKEAGVDGIATNHKERVELAKEAKAASPDIQRLQAWVDEAVPEAKAVVSRPKPDGRYRVEFPSGHAVELEEVDGFELSPTRIAHGLQAYGIEDTPENRQRFAASIKGRFTVHPTNGQPLDTVGVVRIRRGLDADAPRLLRHEFLHAARYVGLITDAEWDAAVKQFHGGKKASESMQQEAVLHALDATPTFFEKVDARISDLLSMMGIPRTTWQQLQRDLRSGAVFTRGAATAETSPSPTPVAPTDAPPAPEAPTSPPDASLPESTQETPPPAEAPPDAPAEPEAVADGTEPEGLAAKNASMGGLRGRMVLSQLPPAERKKWTQSVSDAFERGIPDKASDIAASVVASPRQLDDAETAGLLAKAIDLDNQYDEALAVYDSIPEGFDNATEAAALQRIEQEADLLTAALKKGGTEQGRALNIRRMEMGRDYSVLGLKRRAKASKKGDLTDKEAAAVTADAKKIAAKEKQIERKQKQRKHREVARIKSAIGKVRRTLGLDKVDEKSLEVPGLSEKDNAELNALREKLREAEAEAIAADTIAPDGKVHNRPSEEIVADLDASIARVQAILKEKAAPPDSNTVEMRRRVALEKQLAKARKDLADARRGVAIERRHGPELEIINDLRNQLSAVMGETAAIQQLEANIAEVERRLAEGDFSVPGKKHGPDNETVSSLKARLAELRKEYNAKNPADVIAALEKLKELQTHLENGTLPEAKAAKPGGKPELQVVRDAIAATRKLINKSPRAVKKRLRQSIAELNRRLDENDFALPVKKEQNFFDDEHEELLRELSELKQRARKRVADLRPQNPIKKVASRIANTVKAFVTSGDFAPIFRQGGILTAANPALGYRGAKVGMRAMLNTRTAFLLERHMNEYGARYDRAGLELPETFGEPSDREESFMGAYTEHLPVVKLFVGASERNFNASMNYMRTQVFDALADTLPRNGEATIDELRDIARYVNIASGRGDFSPETQQKLAAIAGYFFSPRYVLSRFQYLAGVPLWKASSARTRKLIAKEYAKTFAGMALLYSLAQAAGGLWEKDPRSSDFGKLVLDGTRMDFGAGLGQTATVTARGVDAIYRTIESLWTNEKRRESAFKDDRNVYNDFLRQKFSPLMALFWDTTVGQSVVHDPVTKTELAKTFVPISFRDVFTEMEAQGVPRGTALFMLSLFGAGMNTYETKQPTPGEAARKRMRLVRTARSHPTTQEGMKRKLNAIKQLQGEQ